MAEIVQFATIRSQLDPSGYTKGAQEVVRSSEQATAAVTKLDVATQKAGRNAALSADGWQRFLGKIDPATRAQQQYATSQSKLNDYVAAGLVSQSDYTRAQGLLKDKMEAAVGSGGALTRTLEGLGNAYGFVARSLGAVGIAISVGAFVDFGKAALENAASLEHEAKVLGLTTREYQAYREASRLAGVDIEDADTALKKYVASAGAALESTGKQRTAFAELGVSANDLAAGPGSSLPKTITALLGIKDASIQANDARAIFGKGGQEIIPLFSQWAQGADALSERLNKMGLVMDDEVAGKAEEAEIRMSTAFDRLKISAAPTVVTVTGWLTDLLGTLTNLASNDWNIRVHALLDVASGLVPGAGILAGVLPTSGGHTNAAPADIISSQGTSGEVLSSQGSRTSGLPAPGTPGTSGWDEAGWDAYLNGRKEEARLTGLSAGEQAAEREAIAESIKLQELNGVAADKINHSYSGAVDILGREGLAHARNIGLSVQQNKAAEKVKDTFEKYLASLTEEVRQASLSASAKEHEADVIKAAQDYQKQHNALARDLVQTYQDAVAVLGQQRVAQVDALVTQKQAAELEQAVLIPQREQIALLAKTKSQREIELQLFQLRLKYGDAAVKQLEAELRLNDSLIKQDDIRQATLLPQGQQIQSFGFSRDQRQTELEIIRLKAQYGTAFNQTLETEYRLNQRTIDQQNADDSIATMREELALAHMMPEERAKEEAVLRELHATHGLLRADQADEIRNIIQQQQDLQKLQELSQGLAEDYGTFFKNWLMTGKADFGSFAKSILSTWIDLLVKMQEEAISKQLFGTLSGGGTSGGSGVFGFLNSLLGGGGIGVDQAANIGDLIHFIPALAEGGPVSPGGTYLVGENGPEIFRPSVGGSIIPNGNGGGMVVHIDARGAQRGVGAEIEAVMHRVAAQHMAAGLPIAISAASKAVTNRARNKGARAA
jgi:hypothetical protein